MVSPTGRTASSSRSLRSFGGGSSASFRASSSLGLLGASASAAASASQPAVVLEIGEAFLRVGFAGESAPRWVAPCSLFDDGATSSSAAASSGGVRILQRSVARWERELTPLLESVFTERLLVRPRSCRVLLVESHPWSWPSTLRRALARVLSLELSVPSSLLLSDPAARGAHAAGRRHGLVVDVGRRETRTAAAFGGRCLPDAHRTVPCGVDTVCEAFRDTINARYGNTSEDGEEDPVVLPTLADALAVMEKCVPHVEYEKSAADDDDDDGVVLACEVPSTGRLVRVPANDVARAWRRTLLDPDDPDRSATRCLLATLEACPVDLRRPLLTNTMLVGGGPDAAAPFFDEAFRGSLLVAAKRKSTTTRRTSSLAASMDALSITPSPFRRSLVSWIGASIMGANSVALADERWTFRSELLEREGKKDAEKEDGDDVGPVPYDWADLRSTA